MVKVSLKKVEIVLLGERVEKQINVIAKQGGREVDILNN